MSGDALLGSSVVGSVRVRGQEHHSRWCRALCPLERHRCGWGIEDVANPFYSSPRLERSENAISSSMSPIAMHKL